MVNNDTTTLNEKTASPETSIVNCNGNGDNSGDDDGNHNDKDTSAIIEEGSSSTPNQDGKVEPTNNNHQHASQKQKQQQQQQQQQNKNNQHQKHYHHQQQKQQQERPKRGLKPKSKRNRKRARSELHSIEDQAYKTHVCPLELDGISAIPTASTTTTEEGGGCHQLWLRTVEPYPYTFSTFAKARWLGRSVLDVYHTEFGSYPKSYYESAIAQGRILVSDKQVTSDYKIKGGDVLTHTVHRHEPGVAVYSKEPPFVKIVIDDDGTNGNGNDNYNDNDNKNDTKNNVLVIDKPATLPIHPCGGYHIQSVMNMLEPIYGKLYTIHRLDRLTSGLVILGKTSPVAQEWGKAIMNRNCQKIYLARVAGKFPLRATIADVTSSADADTDTDTDTNAADGTNKIAFLGRGDKGNETYPINGEWETFKTTTTNTNSTSTSKSTRDVKIERKINAHGFWITNGKGQVQKDANLQDVFDSKFKEESWLENLEYVSSLENNEQTITSETNKDNTTNDGNDSDKMLWLHLACPTRIANPKDGVCEAGSFDDLDDELYLKTVKPAQTSFGIVRYDPKTDSTVVLCRPCTGRTHQIRLHLQHLGHSIANDPNYGGDIWYENPQGQLLCRMAKERLEQMNQNKQLEIDQTINGKVSETTTTETTTAKAETTSAFGASAEVASTISEPATEQEIETGVSVAVRQEDESIHDFIRRTCVWCARQQDGGVNRDLLEFLVRSPGIWLHALKYKFTISNGRSVSYQAPFPSWCQF